MARFRARKTERVFNNGILYTCISFYHLQEKFPLYSIAPLFCHSTLHRSNNKDIPIPFSSQCDLFPEHIFFANKESSSYILPYHLLLFLKVRIECLSISLPCPCFKSKYRVLYLLSYLDFFFQSMNLFLTMLFLHKW